MSSYDRCDSRARGAGGVLQCTLDPDHDGTIHSSGDWFWNEGDTDATQGVPVEGTDLDYGAVPLLDDWGDTTGWVTPGDPCEHSLTEERK